MRPWPLSGDDYRGLVDINETGHAKGTIIVFHGNAGTALDRDYYMSALGSLGYRVLLAEYPKYGGRKGELGESAFVRDAKETVRLACEYYSGPILLLGESLGCGVAAAVAQDSSIRIDGIILITPWDALLEVAKSKFPLFPVRLLLKDKYDNIQNLNKFSGSIAVVGAGLDEVIPIRHAINLYESLPGTKRMWTIQGGGHNDWLLHTDMMWWKEIMEFINGNDMRNP